MRDWRKTDLVVDALTYRHPAPKAHGPEDVFPRSVKQAQADRVSERGSEQTHHSL
jgi:hypothetical protein